MRGQAKALIFFGVVILLLIVSIFAIKHSNGINFSAFFKDARMLKKGDPLVQKGIVIGSVTGISPGADGRIEVELQLQKKNQPLTHSESIAYISDSKITQGGQQVELYPLDMSSRPIQKDSRIEGADSYLELQYWRAKSQIVPSISSFASKVASTASNIQKYLNSPEGRQLTRETRDFLVQAKDWSAEEISDFRAKHPEVEKTIKDQMKEAQRQGNKALLLLLQQIEKNLQDSETSDSKEAK